MSLESLGKEKVFISVSPKAIKNGTLYLKTEERSKNLQSLINLRQTENGIAGKIGVSATSIFNEALHNLPSNIKSSRSLVKQGNNSSTLNIKQLQGPGMTQYKN